MSAHRLLFGASSHCQILLSECRVPVAGYVEFRDPAARLVGLSDIAIVSRNGVVCREALLSDGDVITCEGVDINWTVPVEPKKVEREKEDGELAQAPRYAQVDVIDDAFVTSVQQVAESSQDASPKPVVARVICDRPHVVRPGQGGVGLGRLLGRIAAAESAPALGVGDDVATLRRAA